MQVMATERVPEPLITRGTVGTCIYTHTHTHTHTHTQEQLKTRESVHMTKLGEELQRREVQRQTMLKQKLDHYSSLERQLQDGLQQLAAQQRALAEREVKVRQESERVTRERQLLQDEVQRSQTHFKSQCEQQIEIERYSTCTVSKYSCDGCQGMCVALFDLIIY